MPTKTKAKPAFNAWVEPIVLSDEEVKLFMGILDCKEEVIRGTDWQLERELTMARHWVRHVKSRPLTSHMIAELEPLYTAAHALEELLMPGRISSYAKNKVLSVYMRYPGLSNAKGEEILFKHLDDTVNDLARFTQIAIEEMKFAKEGGTKETGGMEKKVIASGKRQELQYLSLFFDRAASDRAKSRPKDRKEFLRICSQKISN